MRNVRLLLVNPQFARKIDGQMPLNLAYLAGAFKSSPPLADAVEVQICDLNIERNPREALETRLAQLRPTHVGVTRYSPNCRNSIEVLKQAKEFDGKTITVVGGYHEMVCAEETKWLHSWIDHVVSDRIGEPALVKIVAGSGFDVEWQRIFPAYELLAVNDNSYQFHPSVFGGRMMAPFMSSRGCRYECSFCSAGKYTEIPIAIVIDGMWRINDLGNKAIFFNDPNFVSNRKRTDLLVDEMRKGGLGKHLVWGCQTMAENLSEHMIARMADAGMVYFASSMENVSPELLASQNKKIRLEAVENACKFARQHGVKVGLYVMFGIHADEKKDFEMAVSTLDALEKVSPDFVSYSILANYPNAKWLGDYEHFEASKDPVWQFFDEGYGKHPFCSDEHAIKLREEIDRGHKNGLKSTIIF